MPCQLVIELHALQWVCVWCSRRFFLQVSKWKILRSNVFGSNSVLNKEKLLRRLFGCCNGRMERFVWAVRNVTSGTGVSNRIERPSKTSPNLDGIPRQWTTITLRKCLLWFVKIVREVAEEVVICKSSCHLILTEKRKMSRVAAKFVPRLLTRRSLSMKFWRSMRRLLFPSRPTLQIWPLRTFPFSRSENPH